MGVSYLMVGCELPDMDPQFTFFITSFISMMVIINPFSTIATLIAQILSNGYLWYAMKKLNRFHVLPRIRKVIVAGALMAALTALMYTAHVNIIANIAVSGAVYFSTLFFFKESLLGEIKKIIGLSAAEA